MVLGIRGRTGVYISLTLQIYLINDNLEVDNMNKRVWFMQKVSCCYAGLLIMFDLGDKWHFCEFVKCWLWR